MLETRSELSWTAPISLSRKPRRVYAANGRIKFNRFFLRPVRRRNHSSACKCANCPPIADGSCARQAEANSKKCHCHFFDRFSGAVLDSSAFFVGETQRLDQTLVPCTATGTGGSPLNGIIAAVGMLCRRKKFPQDYRKTRRCICTFLC